MPVGRCVVESAVWQRRKFTEMLNRNFIALFQTPEIQTLVNRKLIKGVALITIGQPRCKSRWRLVWGCVEGERQPVHV